GMAIVLRQPPRLDRGNVGGGIGRGPVIRGPVPPVPGHFLHGEGSRSARGCRSNPLSMRLAAVAFRIAPCVLQSPCRAAAYWPDVSLSDSVSPSGSLAFTM